jgi:hypothetical protein
MYKREPVLWMAAVQAVLGLIVAFGVGLTADQTAAIMAASAAVLALVTRTQVTPNAAIAAAQSAVTAPGFPDPIVQPIGNAEFPTPVDAAKQQAPQ